MRPILIKESWNLFCPCCLYVVMCPVKRACFIWSYLHNLFPYNHVTLTDTSYHSFIVGFCLTETVFINFQFKLQNYILCIICVWSLIYSVRNYISQHLLPILLKKLVFPLSVVIIFAACSVVFWVWCHRLFNVLIIDQWYIHHNYNYNWLNHFWDLWFCSHFIKLFVKTQEPCIENMFPERFGVSFIYKENLIYIRKGKVAKGKSLGEAIE